VAVSAKAKANEPQKPAEKTAPAAAVALPKIAASLTPAPVPLVPSPPQIPQLPSVAEAEPGRIPPPLPLAPPTPALQPLRQLVMPLTAVPSAPLFTARALDPTPVQGLQPVPPSQPEYSPAMIEPAAQEAAVAVPPSASVLDLESCGSMVAVLEMPESIEPTELSTAKFPIPNLKRPSAPQSSQLPDPVPAGLTALSANMRAVDDRTRSACTSVVPISAASGRILLGFEELESPKLRHNGSFELHEGQLRPLTLPDVAVPPVAHLQTLEADTQWIPLSEPVKPQPPLTARELEFDPALLRYLDVQEEMVAELRAMDAVGLAPPTKLVFEAESKPLTGPSLQAKGVSPLAWQVAVITVPSVDREMRPDAELRQRVAEYQIVQQEICKLDAAASKSAPMLVFPDVASRIPVRGPGVAISAHAAFRGFTPWPQIGPVGRPVSGFEMEFDAEVLNRVQEWEDFCATAHASEESKSLSETVEAAVAGQLVVDPPVAGPEFVEPKQALVAFGTAATEVEDDEVVVHALTPIVEVTVPPIAKMTRLPLLVLQPRGLKPKPRQAPPQAEFSEFSPLVPTIGKLVKIIPSPIMNIQHSRVMAPPGWLVTAAIALLIPITALGVVNYWILPSQRGVTPVAAAAPVVADPAASSPATPVSPKVTSAPALAVAAPAWKKQLEFTGLRLQSSTVKCLVVNHGKDTPALYLLVTLRSSRGSNESPVGTFRVRLSPLGSGSSREIAEPISFTPPMRSIDWSDLRSDVELLKP